MLRTGNPLWGMLVFLILLFQAHPVFSETGSGVADITTLVVTDNIVGYGTVAISDNEDQDVVEVHYTGWLYDAQAPDHKGKKCYSTIDGKPISFKLGGERVPKGWNLGIPGMKVGGKRTLIIPPELAYGNRGRGPIPPNATLIYEIELLNVIVK